MQTDWQNKRKQTHHADEDSNSPLIARFVSLIVSTTHHLNQVQTACRVQRPPDVFRHSTDASSFPATRDKINIALKRHVLPLTLENVCEALRSVTAPIGKHLWSRRTMAGGRALVLLVAATTACCVRGTSRKLRDSPSG